MTDDGQGGGNGPDPALPPTPGEQPVPPPEVIQQPPTSAATTPPSSPPTPPSTFPGQDAATMRLMPVFSEARGAPSAEAPGQRRIGKYIVKRELGRGGMGAVYLAEQPGLGREVAIKELVPSAAADPIALKRFLQEAQVMARASH